MQRSNAGSGTKFAKIQEITPTIRNDE